MLFAFVTVFPIYFLAVNSFKGQQEIVASPIALPKSWDFGYLANAVWIWNDYLLPFLVIGNNEKKTLTLSLDYAKSLSGQYGNPWELIFPAVLLCQF